MHESDILFVIKGEQKGKTMKKGSIFFKGISVIAAAVIALSPMSMDVYAEDMTAITASEDKNPETTDVDNSAAENENSDENSESDENLYTEAAGENETVAPVYKTSISEDSISEKIIEEETVVTPDVRYIFENDADDADYVFISLGEEGDVLSDVALNYETSGEAKKVSGDVISNVAAFSLEKDENTLISIEGKINGNEFVTDLQEADSSEGVAVDPSEYEPAYEDESSYEASDADYDKYIAQADLYDDSEIIDALEASGYAAENEISTASVDGKYVVVIDPGHGLNSKGQYTGASRTWDGVTYYEDVINLKIAGYLKSELESYGNVDVYLTRDENTNPSLEDRVKYAANLHADMLVSCHINASEKDTAHGLMAMVAKVGTYNTYNAQAGQNIANSILNELLKLGFGNNYGFYIRMSDEKDDPLYYPDGSLADYYGICRYGQIYNVPSMIIEHGFISNHDECVKYFGSEEMLRELGKSDAAGIAKYLGLTKSLNGWYEDENNNLRYYINGIAQTGTIVVDGKKYWLNGQGILTGGWLDLGGMKLFFDPNNGGAAAIGIYKVDGKTYYFDENGVMSSSSGLIEYNGAYYYLYKGEVLSGWYNIENSIMYFDENNGCKAAIGTIVVDGKKYWFNENGRLTGGWLTWCGMKLYFDPNNGCEAVIGVGNVEGKLYLFDKNGVQITGTKTPVIDGDKYYIINDEVQSGWADLGSWVMYLDPENGYKAAVGAVMIGDTVYNFDSNGVLTGIRTGMFVENGKKYLADNKGRYYSGWIDLSPSWRLYFDPNDGNAAATGVREINGRYYSFNPDGVLYRDTMPVIDGKKYMADDNGELYSGWKDLTSDWRLYFDKDKQCAAATGFNNISGSLYYFNKDGVMSTGGTPVIDGKKYIIGSNGKISIGWTKLSDSWIFYCNPNDNGAVLTGWNTIEKKDFYFDSNGLARFGFTSIDGSIYYIDKENGKYAGATVIIDGKKYAFDGEGKQCFGWYTLGSWKMYFDPDNNGAAVTDSMIKDGIKYIFNSDGVLVETSAEAVKRKDPNSGRTYTLEGTFLTDPQIGIDVTEDEFFAAAVYAEGGILGLPGQIAIAMVMLNRVNSESYANTLSYVIYQKTHFEVARNGALTKYLKAFRDKDESILKYIRNAKTMEAVETAKQIMDNYKNNGTPRQIEGISSEYNVEDFGCMYFTTEKAFQKQNLDPVACETFQYKNTIFFNKWIKKS